jgi:hypothetical protein
VFDIYTIIFLALAVFIFLRLRSVLGQRTGRERPPYDPYSTRDAVRGATNDNVVTLPARSADAAAQKPVESAEPAERWKGIAEPGSAVAAGLDAIAGEDKAFDAKHFVAGARAAYEMIVLAYAQGDRRALKNLLSREVYEGFETAIRERESRGDTVETRFVAIDKSDVSAAELRGRVAQMIDFVSKLQDLYRQDPNLKGLVLDLRGNPGGLLEQAIHLARMESPTGFDKLKAPIRRVSTLDVPVPYSPPLEESIGPTEARISAAVRAAPSPRAKAFPERL